jgi:hypothetical protein
MGSIYGHKVNEINEINEINEMSDTEQVEHYLIGLWDEIKSYIKINNIPRTQVLCVRLSSIIRNMKTNKYVNLKRIDIHFKRVIETELFADTFDLDIPNNIIYCKMPDCICNQDEYEQSKNLQDKIIKNIHHACPFCT